MLSLPVIWTHHHCSSMVQSTIRDYRQGKYKNANGDVIPCPASYLAELNKLLKVNGIDRPEMKEIGGEDPLAMELDQFEQDNGSPFRAFAMESQ